MSTAIALDLGGTLIRGALVEATGQILYRCARQVGRARGNGPVGVLVRETLLDVHRWTRDRAIVPAAIGMAVPGLIDPQGGTIRYSANLDVHDLAVADVARETVGLRVAVENDVRTAAWGEWLWGAGQGTRHMAYVSAGTGIAAAVIADGHLYSGTQWAAGELGHIPVVQDGDLCRCGRRGCLETVAGGWGIARRAQHIAATLHTSLPDSAEAVTAETVFRAAARGYPAAVTAVHEAAQFLARAVVVLVRLWDPERVVLGGGMLQAGSPLATAIQEAIRACPLPGQTAPATILSQFGSESGLIGAACLVLPSMRDPRLYAQRGHQ